MHIPKTVITTALVAVALGLGSPVMAQHHRGGGGGGDRGNGSNRGAESRAQSAPRTAPHCAARPFRPLKPQPDPITDNAATTAREPSAHPG
jgi:hypothetical protein